MNISDKVSKIRTRTAVVCGFGIVPCRLALRMAKTPLVFSILLAVCVALAFVGTAWAALPQVNLTKPNTILLDGKPAFAGVCACAVCPERQNDFVWENDKFGMRAYGPGEDHKWSGLDVFNKNTPENVCLEWCHGIDKGNFHENRGKGMDNYTMGASRGVGAVAVFADGEWKTYPNWETSRVIHEGDDYLEFELVYPAFSLAGKMTYHITLKRGERFFRNDVSFEKPVPGDFMAGPGMDLEPKRDHHGSLAEETGLVSLFEDPKGANGKDGSTMSAIFVAPGEKVEMLTDHLNCRVLAFRGRRNFTCWAGASWSLAGEIKTAEAWHDHVRAFRATLVFNLTKINPTNNKKERKE